MPPRVATAYADQSCHADSTLARRCKGGDKVFLLSAMTNRLAAQRAIINLRGLRRCIYDRQIHRARFTPARFWRSGKSSRSFMPLSVQRVMLENAGRFFVVASWQLLACRVS